MTSPSTHGVGLLTATHFDRDSAQAMYLGHPFHVFLFFFHADCVLSSQTGVVKFLRLHVNDTQRLALDTLAAIAPRSQGSGMVVMAPCQTILVLMHLM